MHVKINILIGFHQSKMIILILFLISYILQIIKEYNELSLHLLVNYQFISKTVICMMSNENKFVIQY